MKNRGGEKRGGRGPELIGSALAAAAAAAWAAWSLYAATAPPPRRAEDYACARPGPAAALRASVNAGGAAEGPDRCSNAVRYLVGRRMDLNTAAAADLDLLPGIGPETARRILESRDRMGGFHRREDFARVPDLGREARAGLETWADVK